MIGVLLGIYFTLIGAIGLFAITVDAKLLALLAFIIGIGLLAVGLYPFADRFRPRR